MLKRALFTLGLIAFIIVAAILWTHELGSLYSRFQVFRDTRLILIITPIAGPVNIPPVNILLVNILLVNILLVNILLVNILLVNILLVNIRQLHIHLVRRQIVHSTLMDHNQPYH